MNRFSFHLSISLYITRLFFRVVQACARVCVCELTSLAFFFLCRACTLSRCETLSCARKGTGKSFCSACQGSGINNHDIHDDFNSEVHIVINGGKLEVDRIYFRRIHAVLVVQRQENCDMQRLSGNGMSRSG